MTSSPSRLAGLVLATLLAATSAQAESFASSASSAGSASVGSLSDSLRGSSNSSSRDREVSEGEYRVTAVARAERPERVRLALQAAARANADGELVLEVPRAAIERRTLAAGDRIQVRRRAYGFEFAHADTREPFFLALADDWHGGLDPRPVTP